MLRRDLGTPLPAASWPATIHLGPYQASLAAGVYQLMQEGYADGGDLPELDTWRRHFETDAEYDPALCFIAHDAEGLVGVAQCWTSAYIKDLVVHPAPGARALAVPCCCMHSRCFASAARVSSTSRCAKTTCRPASCMPASA